MDRFKSIAVISYEAVMKGVMGLPRYSCFCRVKAKLLAVNGAKIGRRVVIYPGVWIMTGRNLVVGDDVDIAKDVIITTGGGVRIGDRTLIGYRTNILSSNHRIPPSGEKIFSSGHDRKAVEIGSDVWIGANCVIVPGVAIGNHAVVAAGSVVTHDVMRNTVVAGNPARLIRNR